MEDFFLYIIVLISYSIIRHKNNTTSIVKSITFLIHLVQIPEAEASIQDIAIDPEGKMMAAVNNKGNCYVWSLGGEPPRPVPRKHIQAHRKYALRCKFSHEST